MKSLTEYIITESEVLNKFSRFSAAELKRFATIVDRLKQFKNLDKFKKNGKVDVEFGHQYIVRFKNPFTNIYKFCAGTDEHHELIPFKDTQPDTVTALGVGDKFGGIHLVNVWENDGTIILKWQEKRTGKSENQWGETETYKIPARWVLTRKGVEGYRVRGFVDKDKSRSELWYFADDKISHGVYNMPISVDFVVDAYKLKDEMKAFDEKVEKEERERAEEEERKRIERNRKQAYDDFVKRITLTDEEKKSVNERKKKSVTDKSVKPYKDMGEIYISGSAFNYPDYFDNRIFNGKMKFFSFYWVEHSRTALNKHTYYEAYLLNEETDELYRIRNEQYDKPIYDFLFNRMVDKGLIDIEK